MEKDQQVEDVLNTPETVTPESIKKGLNLPSAIIIAAVIIASSIFINRGNAGSLGQSSETPLDLVADVTEEDVVRGDPKADITIIEYADFSCGYCAKYHPTLQQIVNESEGKVRWVYRHLPIFNKEAAIASSCVGKLGGDSAFWTYADSLYLNKDKFSSDFYRSEAVKLGIEEAQYDYCIGDQILKSKIDREFTEARLLLGFNATPYTVIVDKAGRKFSFAGALPYTELKVAIDGLAK